MEFRRRTIPKPLRPPMPPAPSKPNPKSSTIQASDALPLPIRHTNKLFSALFMVSIYYLMCRWRDKIRTSTPLHLLTLSEISAVVGFVASLIYLISFFGIAYVQSFVSSHDDEDDVDVGDFLKPPFVPTLLSGDDEEIVSGVISGNIASHSLEARIGDCRRAAGIRREAIGRMTGRGMEGLPLDGFDYESILGQCCEMPIGYVQLPVGIAGPLVLNGEEYFVPMATTEGCLVASTNRGFKAIKECGGATSVVLKDGMTRAPVVRFATAKRAAELKFFLEDEGNFEMIAIVFNRYG